MKREHLKPTSQNSQVVLQQYQELYDSVPHCYFLIDLSGTVLTVNRYATVHLGYSKPELVGRSIFDTFHPDDRASLETGFLALVSSIGEVLQLEAIATWTVRQLRHDQTTIWMKAIAQVLRFPDSAPLVALLCEDISGYKRIEDRLHLLEQAIISSCNSIVITDATLPDQPILYVNPCFERTTGYSAQEVIGKNCRFLQGSDHQQPEIDVLRTAIQQGERCRVTLRNYRKDGSLFWNELYVAPIVNDQGQITSFVGVQNDITERKRAEEELRRSEEKFRRLMEHAADAFFVHDMEGRFVDVNQRACESLGYTRDELLSLSVADIDLTLDAQTIVNIWSQLSTGQPFTLDGMHRRKDGTVFPVEVRVRLFESGERQLILALARDITERQQAEQVLRQQAERESVIRTIAERIRRSLNLDDILNTTVAEVQQMLQVERVFIYRFEADWSGTVEVESVASGYPSMLGVKVVDSFFRGAAGRALYEQGRIQAIDDLHIAKLSKCHINLLTQFQIRANLVVPILQEDRLWGLLVANQCSQPRQWQRFEIDLLIQLATQVGIAIQQAQLYKHTQRQAQREQALNRFMQAIRSSLDLNRVFATAAEEVSQLLQIDRAKIVQHLPERQIWRVVADYRHQQGLLSGTEMEIPDVANPLGDRLKQLETVCIQDTRLLEDGVNRELAEAYPGAWLLVPLHFRDQFWGCLALLMEHQAHDWDDVEVALVGAIANQLGMAIQQAELYQQVQRLNSDLERQVQARTAELELSLELEATLKRITDKVRDSLDESQILQTAVRELGLALKVDCCDTGIYDADHRTSTVSYEYTRSMPSIRGHVYDLVDSSCPDVYSQLFQGRYCQVCFVSLPNSARSIVQSYTILACPLVDDQGVLGDIWLFKSSQTIFSELEIRLVQQVANQCAIALRQARLHQAVQSQVKELERLNQLKDDFLSTVSHELRSPVANMKMAIQMLQVSERRDRSNPADVQEASEKARFVRYLQILHNECQREIELINDLLDLQHLEAGTQTLRPAAIELSIWLPQIAEPFQERALAREQTLMLHVVEKLPALISDAASLKRVVAELLNNACKYTPPGGTIDLYAIATGETVQISVSNSGNEIPQAELTRIFDKFYRIPQSDPWRQGGTGLGLALVKQLTELLGGDVWVESGEGRCRFTVELPLQRLAAV